MQVNLTFDYTNARKIADVNGNTVRDAKLGRTGAENIMNKEPGYAKTPPETFSLFFSNYMINRIVFYTNAAIKRVIERFSDFLRTLVSILTVPLLTILTFEHFLEINISGRLSGWIGCVAQLFVTLKVHITSFQQQCPKIVLNLSIVLITFGDKLLKAEYWKNDKFFCMRKLFEITNQHNAKWRYPSELLAIDEMFYPCRRAIGFI